MEALVQTENYNMLVFKSQQNIDDEDDTYQKEVGAAIAGLPTASSTLKYRRSAKIAKNALVAARYLCEANPSHVTFKLLLVSVTRSVII